MNGVYYGLAEKYNVQTRADIPMIEVAAAVVFLLCENRENFYEVTSFAKDYYFDLSQLEREQAEFYTKLESSGIL